jgi:alkanesulfonate monooxygenase SsuD/methylene tetrahydromethanopterin reductase-like flavin-dependent oxidoreductase (luciferase family)
MIPFAPGSVSLRLYPHLDLPAPQIVEELRAQAALASEHGFDGVMTSEHHGGFAGYLPNPLQAAGFALDAMPTGWAAPCPLLLPLRPAALVIEEIAWLAARHPGRVGLGVAAGALPADFEIMDTTMDDLTARFSTALAEVARVLTGGEAGALAGDPAVAAAANTRSVLRAAEGTAARRAARSARLVLTASLPPKRARRRLPRRGRSWTRVLVRRLVGELPTQLTPRGRPTRRAAGRRNWGTDELAAPDPAEVTARRRCGLRATR